MNYDVTMVHGSFEQDEPMDLIFDRLLANVSHDAQTLSIMARISEELDVPTTVRSLPKLQEDVQKLLNGYCFNKPQRKRVLKLWNKLEEVLFIACEEG